MIILPAVPERKWKITSAIFVNALLAIGLYLFIVKDRGLNSDSHGFWLLWLGFVGLAAIGTLSFERVEIRQHSFELIKTRFFLGLIPLSIKRHSLAGAKYIKRYVKRASGYDSGSDGIYRPSIVLVCGDGKEILIQQFFDCASNVHPLSQQWARKIAEASGLQVIDIVESW